MNDSHKIVIPLRLSDHATKLEIIWIPAATFRMGSGIWRTSGGLGDDYPDDPFDSVLSNGYWIGKYLVTQAQWVSLMDYNPSNNKGANLPVENVDWFEASNFCSSLGRIDLPGAIRALKAQLPSEAQWEYACCGLTETRFSSGNTKDELSKIAWFNDNSNRTTQPVGLLAPNQFGIYDMHGNVFEWCRDWAGAYPDGIFVDWEGPPIGNFKILRGGCAAGHWQDDSLKAKGRAYLAPDEKFPFLGFRVVFS